MRRGQALVLISAMLIAGVVASCGGENSGNVDASALTPHEAGDSSEPAGPCKKRQLKFQVSGGSIRAEGPSALGFSFKRLSGPACKLDATLKIAVVGPDGEPLEPVQNNPAEDEVRWVVTKDLNQLIGDYAWSNWCGTSDGLGIRAEVGRWRASAPLEEVAYCESAASPSRVSHIDDDGACFRWLRRSPPPCQKGRA